MTDTEEKPEVDQNIDTCDAIIFLKNDCKLYLDDRLDSFKNKEIAQFSAIEIRKTKLVEAFIEMLDENSDSIDSIVSVIKWKNGKTTRQTSGANAYDISYASVTLANWANNWNNHETT